MNTLLVLCSGGVDSITSAALLKAEGYLVHLLHVDYGQLTKAAETQAISICSEKMDIDRSHIHFVDVASIGRWGSGSLVNEYDSITDYFPNRNLFLLSTGAVVAASLKAQGLTLGIVDAQNALFADCEPEFMDSCARTLTSLRPALKFIAPLSHMTKQQVVKLALDHDVPLSLTFSCNRNRDRHCWQCPGCIERMKAFKEVGVPL